MENEIKVGQVLYFEFKSGEVGKAIVTKVGRKYFYVDCIMGLYFDKKTLAVIAPERDVFNLYRTEQEIKDRAKKKNLIEQIQLHFLSWKAYQDLTLEQLRSIAEIIGIK